MEPSRPEPKEVENPPAFPRPASHDRDDGYIHQEGMGLRDYFAAKAMQALIASRVHAEDDWMQDQAYCAGVAFGYADAMLAAREARP